MILPLLMLMQFTPQTPKQMLFEEWKGTPPYFGSEPVNYDKAPIDAMLPYVHEDDEPPSEITWKHVLSIPEVTDSDSPVRPMIPGLRIRLAQSVTNDARISLAFAPGLSVGSGVLSWRATACNVTEIPQPVDQGDVETAAIGTGIPVVGYGEAQDTNRLYRNTSRPVRASQLIQGGAGLATVLIAAKVIAATGPWGAAAGALMYASGALVSYWKSITPADLSTRFTGSAILVDGSSVMLPAKSNQNHCGTWEFFARYGTSNSAIPAKGSPARSARRITVQ